MRTTALLIFGLLTTVCSAHQSSAEESIIYSSQEDLHENLKKAHIITLETGRSITVRLKPTQNKKRLLQDIDLAQRAIEETFGEEYIISVERPGENISYGD